VDEAAFQLFLSAWDSNSASKFMMQFTCSPAGPLSGAAQPSSAARLRQEAEAEEEQRRAEQRRREQDARLDEMRAQQLALEQENQRLQREVETLAEQGAERAIMHV
jgi:predicted phage gp36 major capsid-like protein